MFVDLLLIFFFNTSVGKVDELPIDFEVIPCVEILSLSKLSSLCISQDDDSMIFSKMALPFKEDDLVSNVLSMADVNAFPESLNEFFLRACICKEHSSSDASGLKDKLQGVRATFSNCKAVASFPKLMYSFEFERFSLKSSAVTESENPDTSCLFSISIRQSSMLKLTDLSAMVSMLGVNFHCGLRSRLIVTQRYGSASPSPVIPFT